MILPTHIQFNYSTTCFSYTNVVKQTSISTTENNSTKNSSSFERKINVQLFGSEEAIQPNLGFYRLNMDVNLITEPYLQW